MPTEDDLKTEYTVLRLSLLELRNFYNDIKAKCDANHLWTASTSTGRGDLPCAGYAEAPNMLMRSISLVQEKVMLLSTLALTLF